MSNSSYWSDDSQLQSSAFNTRNDPKSILTAPIRIPVAEYLWKFHRVHQLIACKCSAQVLLRRVQYKCYYIFSPIQWQETVFFWRSLLPAHKEETWKFLLQSRRHPLKFLLNFYHKSLVRDDKNCRLRLALTKFIRLQTQVTSTD